MRTATILFSAFFWTFFAVTAMSGLIVGALIHWALWALGIDRDRRFIHRYVIGWVYTYLRMNPWWRIELVGLEKLPRRAAVMVSNHRSLADILIAFGLPIQYRFVAKRSLFSLPLVGWAMTLCGYVRLVRGDSESAKQMMIDCKRWLACDIPVYIYPEGTYGPGDRLLPFKRGAFALAMEEKVPIVPMAITGSPSLIDGDGPLISMRARVRLEVLEAIEPAEFGDDPIALGERVRARISAALGLPVA